MKTADTPGSTLLVEKEADKRRWAASVCLDRLLHHFTTMSIRGESYRLKERRKAGLLAAPEKTERKESVPTS